MNLFLIFSASVLICTLTSISYASTPSQKKLNDAENMRIAQQIQMGLGMNQKIEKDAKGRKIVEARKRLDSLESELKENEGKKSLAAIKEPKKLSIYIKKSKSLRAQIAAEKKTLSRLEQETIKR
ncbi:MAG: hypothetical protein AB7O96_04115 [Pseudobdellovibrionaceae bacterium]